MWLGLGLRREDGFGLLEAFELGDGEIEVALGGVNEALEAADVVADGEEGLAELGLGVGLEEVGDFVEPDLGRDPGEAAEHPDGVDGTVEEVALSGGEGLIAEVVLAGEVLMVGEVFARDDLGLGVDAGFQGILGGAGFAFLGAGPGRFVAHK